MHWSRSKRTNSSRLPQPCEDFRPSSRPCWIVSGNDWMRLDADASHGSIELSGPEIPNLLEGADSVYLLVVLGFAKSGSESLTKRIEEPLGPALVPLLRFLRERSIPVSLSTSARSVLQQHLDYLRAFELARSQGNKIQLGAIDFTPGPGFRRVLKSYQKPGAALVAELPYATNFSVPGSGKTAMVLAGYSVLLSRGTVEKLLVVGPRAAFDPWQDEFRACFSRPLFCGRISGPPDQRKVVLDNASRFE